MPFLLYLILIFTPSPTLLSHAAMVPSIPSESQPIKVLISEGCVSDSSKVEGQEVDLTPGSPLVLTHKIHLVPGAGSGSCCPAEFAAVRERLEALEREVSELREKCGGLDGGCCTSQQSKGAGCTTPTEECLNDCGDQGRCVDGKCVCFPGFSGPDCSVIDCPGGCSNKGKCVNGKCVCDPGFTGPDCSIKACPKDCSNQGRCVNGKCVCNAGFTGPDCSTAQCPGNCNNKGRCVNGKCVCDTGFTGPDCSERSCPGNCNNKGRCVNGKCVCNPGFTGPDCSARSCPGNCNNKGRCVDGKCVCDTGFTGPDCSERSCPGNCNNKGRCVNGQCVCDTGFTGPDCSERSCPNNCHNKGRCVNGKCVCDTGFTGPDCSERSCPGNCNNNGRCVNGKCVCDSGFTGPDCSQLTCPNNCNNKGRCVNGQCVCEDGFTGQDCSTKSCPDNCSNKGRCVNGKCLCNPGFAEPDCRECKDGFTGPDCATALIAVSNLSTRNITESSVTLFWTPPLVQYNAYHITFTSEKESDQKITATVTGGLNTYTQVGLAPGQRYTVTIIGEKDGKMGAKSTTTFQTLISGPKNLRVVKTSTTSVIVQWEEAQGGIDRYILSISPNQTDGSSKGRKDMRLPPGRDSAQIDGLQAGRLYDISLVAVKDGTQSLPAIVQATPGLFPGLPDPASRTTRGSGGISHLRLKNTTKGSSSQYQSFIDSSRGHNPESSGYSVEPTVMTERNLTAYGLNNRKYVRRVLVGHRKIDVAGQISRNDILTHISDRLAGFSDEIRKLPGKGLKLQDGRFEENPIREVLRKKTLEKNKLTHQQEGVPKARTYSEVPIRIKIQEKKSGTTPSPSIPLTMPQAQPSLVPSETLDQRAKKNQTPSRDRHHTETSLSRKPTKSISSMSSSQKPEYINQARNAFSFRPSHPLAVEKETLKRNTTASQESQPDDQGLLTSVQGLNRISSESNSPEGTTHTDNIKGGMLPKDKQTINKTVPSYRHMPHRGMFPRRPNAGLFPNRTIIPQHPYRNPVSRPLNRLNSTARNILGPRIISSVQRDPNHTPIFTWRGKNRTVIRFPPKHLSQINPNQNDSSSKPGVAVPKKTSEEFNVIFSTDNNADPTFNISLPGNDALSNTNDTIQPVIDGVRETTDHILPRVTNRHNGTTWKSDWRNASNLKIRPIHSQKKNNAVIRLPSIIHSQTGSPTKTGTNLSDNSTLSTENVPVATNKTLQAINGGSENTIDHTNKGLNLHTVTNRDQDLSRIINRDKGVSSVTNRDQNLSRITNRDKGVSRVTNRDQDLLRITNRDHRLPKVTEKDQDLSSATKKVINRKVPPKISSSKENVQNQNLTAKFILRQNGRLQQKPNSQIKQNSTTQNRVKDTEPRVEKGSKQLAKGNVQSVAQHSEGDTDNIPLRMKNMDNSTTKSMEHEFNSLQGLIPNYTASFTMRKQNGTDIRHTPNPKIQPNPNGGPNWSNERSTNRSTLPIRPNLTRKNGTTIRLRPKVFSQMRPKSTTTADPKPVWSMGVPLSRDKTTSQRNTTVLAAGLSEDSISQVGVKNVTSGGFIIIWAAPERRFKNFVIKIIEDNNKGINEGDGRNQMEIKERNEGSEIATNFIDVVMRNSSNNGVRKKFIKLLPGSARSYPVTNLTSQTNYLVTLSGTGPGLRSNVHTIIITTGPEPPSHLTFSDLTDTSLTVSWRKPKSSVTGFKITYIHTKEGEPNSLTVDSTVSSLPLSKLSPGSTYEVSVISVLGLDESDPIKDMVITLPDPPTDLRAINITDTKALLLWRPALATVDQYIIDYHAEEDPGAQLNVRVSGNAVEQQLQSLKASTKYTVTIISRLGEQKSASTHTTFTTASGSPGKGEAPRDLTARQVTARTAVLSWKPPSSAVTSYKLTYFTKGGERKEVTLNPGVREHKLRGLHPSSTYTALLQGERGGVYTAAISTEFTTGTLRFPYPTDCSQELMNGETDSGLVEIYPGGQQGQPVMVYCDMETDGGGWTVFQRRKDGKTNFFRGWQDYRKGFGDLEGEFWLGNDFLHNLTMMTPMTLRVDLSSGQESVYAHYSTFSVDTMKKHYTMKVSGYSGTAGDSLKYHDKRAFSTYDRDPQPFITRCAMSYRGGWWYKNCHEANLNGLYNTPTNHQGVIWTAWKGKKFSISFTEMKIRPASFKPHSQG